MCDSELGGSGVCVIVSWGGGEWCAGFHTGFLVGGRTKAPPHRHDPSEVMYAYMYLLTLGAHAQ